MNEDNVPDTFRAAFRTTPDRLAWSAQKWEKYRGRDIIALWVADMDFPTAPAILEALQAQVAHGVFGYMDPPHDLADALAAHYAAHYGWAIAPEWIVWLPGLVLSLHLAVRACCAEGEEVLTFTPVYPPFVHAARQQGRSAINVPLRLDEAQAARGRLRYRIDFAALEAATTPHTRLLLLCHPHNPVGTVFSDEELATLAQFCARHALTVCSDEVHGDLILDADRVHRPFAPLLGQIGAAHLARTITVHGPGKVFNLAGLGIAWAIIPDATLRRRYRAAMAHLVPAPCGLGYTALRAALDAGEPWRQALLAQLRQNRDALCATLDALGLAHAQPEVSYLCWIDMRKVATRVGNPALWLEQHGLGLNDGAAFGAPGFVRWNFALTPDLQGEALRRLRAAMATLG